MGEGGRRGHGQRPRQEGFLASVLLQDWRIAQLSLYACGRDTQESHMGPRSAVWQRMITTRRSGGIREGGLLISEGAQEGFLEEGAF